MKLEYSYLNLPGVMHSKVAPEPVAKPGLVVFNEALATDLGLDLSGFSEEDKADLFAGNRLPEQAQPLAQAYAGHQFGHFTMLGDGRAHLIGEQVTPGGDRVDIQMKGSGQTPYSRRGDGRAVLGPMLREYLISEAMAALGIPTTRALAVVSTGEQVMRETRLPGAILTRVAASHIRVGTFQFASAHEDRSILQSLLDYTVQRHEPEFSDADNKALALLEMAMNRQADLIVHWMRVGFIHGVMNTDNMALSGQTIDYGPCAFMDSYDPGTVFSSIDTAGRYAYANQPAVAAWNLARLAEALLPLIDENPDRAVEIAEARVNGFAPIYREKWLEMMRAKLGLCDEEDADMPLITDLLGWMQKNHADYTNTFRDLGRGQPLTHAPYTCKTFSAWYKRWQTRRRESPTSLEASFQMMRRTNPAVIPRNHKVEEALAAATAGDLDPFFKLYDALKAPYNGDNAPAQYQQPPEPSDRVYQTFCGT